MKSVRLLERLLCGVPMYHVDKQTSHTVFDQVLHKVRSKTSDSLWNQISGPIHHQMKERVKDEPHNIA